MWEIASVICKKICEKDSKPHLISMITSLEKINFAWENLNEQQPCKMWEQAPTPFEKYDIKHLQNLSSGMITCFN